MTTDATEEPRFRAPSAPPAEVLERMGPEELREHLRALHGVTEAVLAHLVLADLLRELLSRLREILEVDAATVLLCSDDGEALVVRASSGLEEEVAQRVRVPLGQGIAGAVAAGRQAVIVDDVAGFPTHSRLLRRLSSLMAAPLLVEGDLLGVLHVGTRRPRLFSDAQLILMQMVADRVALAIKNALLYDRATEQIAARQRVEAALAESERRHRILADTAADAIITMDADSVIVSANPAAAEVFGYSVEELIGMQLQALIPERYRAAHRAGVLRYLETGRRRIPWRGLELPGLHRSGREVLLEVAFAEAERDGERLFTGTMRDITERKRAERLLAAQHAVTRVLAESGTVDEAVPRILRAAGEALRWDMAALWTWDEAAGLLRLVDLWAVPEIRGGEFEAVSRQTTFAPGVGLPGRVWEGCRPVWIPDVTRDDNFPRLAAASRAGLHSAFGFPVCLATDCVGVIEFFTREMPEPDPGVLEAMEALGSDIGQFIRRREAEERLRAREEVHHFFAQISAALAASALDYDLTLRKLARLAVPTLGDWCTVYVLRPGGAIERLEMAHADPEQEPLARELERYPVDPSGAHPANQVIRTGEPLLLREVSPALLRDIAQDERHRETIEALGVKSCMVVPLTARGRTLGSITLISARAERRYGPADLEVAEEFARRAALAVDNARLYRDLQAANRAKSEFMATISHELRTPLNAVIGYAELIREGVAGETSERARGYVERIALSAHHLSELIEEVLTFSRLEAGREVVSAERVRLGEVLEETQAIAEPLAADKGLRFTVRAPEPPAEMTTDPRKLRQVLLNLTSNAIKFTESGEVELSARVEEEQAVFEIRDTGIGIEPEHAESIFEPFWQVEQGTTRVAGGTGLGLSVSRRLVDLLGGEITLRSAPGEGSTFVVRLPLRVPGEER